MQEGYLVEHRGEPLALLLPVHIESPDGVTQRLRTHRHLRGESLLREMHQCTAELEVLREVILPVHTQHRLALHTVVGVRLQRHTDVCARIDDALVQYGHLTGRVIYGIVGAFHQFDTTCRHHDRPLRHVIGTKGDDIGTMPLKLSHHHELILLGNLLCDGLRRVVEF